MKKFHLIIFCSLLLVPLKMYAQRYNPADVAVINALIANNGLNAIPDDPASWTSFASWNNAKPKQITKLRLNRCRMYGTASFAGLTQMKELRCNDNRLTELDVSKCTQLYHLECRKNNLTELDVTKCTKLQWMECDNNNLTELDVTECTQLEMLICDKNVKKIFKKEALESDRVEQIQIISFSSFSICFCNFFSVISVFINPKIRNRKKVLSLS